MTPSTTPIRSRLRASILSALAATEAIVASFHRIEAQPSGLITEYTPCSLIRTSSATASASAPPLPPSPMMIVTTGTGRPVINWMHCAIAMAWPCSSASTPGYAPGVSMKVITGSRSFPASRISLAAFR
jgi:hypothetical protein